jgi:hypothetical protein
VPSLLFRLEKRDNLITNYIFAENIISKVILIRTMSKQDSETHGRGTDQEQVCNLRPVNDMKRGGEDHHQLLSRTTLKMTMNKKIVDFIPPEREEEEPIIECVRIKIRDKEELEGW